MMNWFFKWLGGKIQHSQYEDEAQEVGLIPRVTNRARNKGLASMGSVGVKESDQLGSEPITFKMFKASGGWAIEFRQYDNKSDRIDTSLYVVNDEQELGNHVSQIITMEALKR